MKSNEMMRSSTESHTYHCVGVGVGPSNLSLASLADGRPELRTIFFEKKPSFGWHDGMLLRDLHLQVSLFKDLVTLADPKNRFSFLSYLHSQGKIYHYINAHFDSVPLQEYANYLNWASANNANVHFGEEVVKVDFDGAFQVETTKRRLVAHNISIGVGTEPFVPEFARGHLGDTNFHTTDLGYHTNCYAGKRVTVVGGGQAGGEAVLHLLGQVPANRPAAVTWISRRANYAPLDDSPFTNDFFMPSYSDYFAAQRSEVRHDFVREHVLASDGVSEHTLRDIYQAIYRLKFVDGPKQEISLRPGRTVTALAKGPGGWTLTSTHHDSGARERLDTDIVVWATGLRPGRTDFLQPIRHLIDREGDEFRIDDDFAVQWDGPSDRRLFVLNGARHQRGLADPNLSLLAWRSQRVIDRISGGRGSGAQEPSFVSWASVGARVDSAVQ
jgi:lysine N6-hydroxylase